MAKAETYDRKAAWFLKLFGSVFLIVGLGMGFVTVKNLYRSIAAKSWVDTPAIVQAAELDTSYDSDDGSTTYRATGEFEYEWDGRTYRSDRIFFGSGYDSQKKYHRAIVTELSHKMRNRQELIVKVNPKAPEQAVAFPKIRWGMTFFMSMFAVIFGGAGAGVMFLGFYGGRHSRRESERRERHPGKPWLWRDEWQSNAVQNDSKFGFYGALAFTVFWNLLGWTGAIVGFPQIWEDNKLFLPLIALFPLIGLFMIYWTWKLYRQWKLFGRTELILDTYPAALGGALLARLRLYLVPPDDAEFHVKLTCLKEEQRGSGDNRRTVETIIWQDEQLLSARHGRNRETFDLPIRFAIPPDEPATSETKHGDPYLWRLKVKAEAGFTDLDQSFEIPVFDPNEYDITIPDEARKLSENPAPKYEYQGNWQRTGVVYTNEGQGHYYFFPAARDKGTALMITFMTLVFGSVGIAPWFSDMPIFFGIVFGLAGLGLGVWAAHLWLLKSAIDISDGFVTIRRGLFRGKFRDVPLERVKGVEIDSTMSSGETKYYDIHLRLQSGERPKIADHLLGRRDVQDLIRKFERELGLETTGKANA